MDDKTPSSGVIRHYRLERKLGEGGMGVVYEAYDPQLERSVAIKMIREGIEDETQRRRLMREARVAAGINHPNICHVYEVGEESGELYIVMELLEGEPLAARIERSPLPLPEALEVTLGILAALERLHDRGIIHRDLKPSNVFLTPHGVKLLDFGLARSGHGDPGMMDVTQPGAIMGTPRYMAPEQWTGSQVGPATDVFALGAILFEMIAGRPVFEGATAMEVCHAVANKDPETLQGGREMALIDRVIQRALAKDPAGRYSGAEPMAAVVREALRAADSGEPVTTEIGKRLMVLPFRLLRPDTEVEFLTTSLPEAIVVSLSSLDSLVVRSSAMTAGGSGDQLDLQAISREAGVDAVLTGSVLRAGDQIRLTTQLIETPGGAVLASKAAQVSMGDILQVHDDLVREIIESLSLSLSPRESRRLKRDKPDSAMTYERYLRANQLSNNRRLLAEARDLYLQCLEEDPQYAPAWARLGRVYRVMAKYETDGDEEENFRNAEEAFRKALEIDPELSLAHNLYTFMEVEEMGRAKEAMVRLLERVNVRPSDADLFAGLVLACRFCGLLEASVEADRRARRIDPGILTSVQYTYWLLGDFERAMAYDTDDMRWTYNYALLMLGRDVEAAERSRRLEASGLPGLEQHVARVPRAAVEGNREECVTSARTLLNSRFHDPEGLYFMGRAVAKVGETDLAFEFLERVVGAGFSCPKTMREDAWLAGLAGEPRFAALLEKAEEQHQDARRAFVAAGGDKLLGMSA